MYKNAFASKALMDMIKKLPESKSHTISFAGYDLNIVESPLLPIEIQYDACDIETKEVIKIASGKWIHWFAVPDMQLKETLGEENQRKDFWGNEFKNNLKFHNGFDRYFY